MKLQLLLLLALGFCFSMNAANISVNASHESFAELLNNFGQMELEVRKIVDDVSSKINYLKNNSARTSAEIAIYWEAEKFLDEGRLNSTKQILQEGKNNQIITQQTYNYLIGLLAPLEKFAINVLITADDIPTKPSCNSYSKLSSILEQLDPLRKDSAFAIIERFNYMKENSARTYEERVLYEDLIEYLRTGNLSATYEVLKRGSSKEIITKQTTQFLYDELSLLDNYSKYITIKVVSFITEEVYLKTFIGLPYIGLPDEAQVKNMLAASARLALDNTVLSSFRFPEKNVCIKEEENIERETWRCYGEYGLVSTHEQIAQFRGNSRAYQPALDQYRLNPAYYILYRSINPNTSMEALFNAMRSGKKIEPTTIVIPEQNLSAQQWVCDILRDNYKDARRNHPQGIAVYEATIKSDIYRELKRVFSEDLALAKLFCENSWKNTRINVETPLGTFDINLGKILQEVFLQKNIQQPKNFSAPSLKVTIEYPERELFSNVNVELKKYTDLLNIPPEEFLQLLIKYRSVRYINTPEALDKLVEEASRYKLSFESALVFYSTRNSRYEPLLTLQGVISRLQGQLQQNVRENVVVQVLRLWIESNLENKNLTNYDFQTLYIKHSLDDFQGEVVRDLLMEVKSFKGCLYSLFYIERPMKNPFFSQMGLQNLLDRHPYLGMKNVHDFDEILTKNITRFKSEAAFHAAARYCQNNKISFEEFLAQNIIL